MNVIKFKDKIIDGNDLFNKKFKGKYTYWVHMKYAISFDDITTTDYVRYETCENLSKVIIEEGVEYIDSDDYLEYIDYCETDRVNRVREYIMNNSFTPDDDITLEEVKKFRTWLASELLKFDEYGVFDELERHVLEYYRGGMYNDVVKFLTDFGTSQTTISNPVHLSQCSCQNSASTNASMTLPTISSCDPLHTYKHNIYKKMVEMFGDINFWLRFDDNSGFIEEFKKYIDNVAKCNLVLHKSEYVSDFVDCGCDTTDEQSDMIKILQKLSQSLQYIIDKDIKGHKNYITDSLDSWARYLYELMEW